MMAWLRVFGRFLLFVTYTLWCFLRYFGLRLAGYDKARAANVIKEAWLRFLPHRLGLRIHVEGSAQPSPCLYVANHIAYVDPIPLFMHLDARVVAKAEVRRWPIIGFAAGIIRTIFVRRDEKNSRHAAAEAIQHALESGISILVFPEGTTSEGNGTLPFRPRSFEAAGKAGVPVQPIAMWYDTPLAAYVGNDTFLPHFFRLFRLKQFTCFLVFGPALTGPDTTERAQSWIDSILKLNHHAHGRSTATT